MTGVPVIVEFLGIVRQRAGCEQQEFSAQTLSELWLKVGQRFPQLEGVCFDAGDLKEGYLASVDGERFTRSTDLLLHAGNRILLLSADAGG